MDGDDWTGGGNEEGERERDNYSYEVYLILHLLFLSLFLKEMVSP